MKGSLETEIGLAIQTIRRQQHMTRKELAQRAGLTLLRICELEDGRCNPSLKTLKHVAKGMGKELHIEFR